jgi:hypothetical protein
MATTYGKYLLIAVDINTGEIRTPEDEAHHFDPYPRVVGLKEGGTYEGFVPSLFIEHQQNPNKGAEKVKKAANPNEPHQGPNKPEYVGTILHTHNSPGCTWVIINGWPFCYS